MATQEKKCNMDRIKTHRHWMLIKLIILFVWIAIWLAIGGHERWEGRWFEKWWFWMKGWMMFGKEFGEEKDDDKKLTTEQQAKLDADKVIIKDQMQKIWALQDDYSSIRRFIQRWDTTNASTRIDSVSKELAQLKIDLPTISTLKK